MFDKLSTQISAHPELLTFFLIGIILGVLITIAAWKGNAYNTSYSDDPRVKATIWGISSLLVVLIGDWNTFLHAAKADANGNPIEVISRLGIFLSYVLGFSFALIATLFSTTGFFLVSQETRPHRVRYVTNFLFYGLDYANQQQKQYLTDNRQSEKTQELAKYQELNSVLKEEIEEYRKITRHRSASLATLQVEVAYYLRNRAAGEKRQLCKRILDDLCTAAKLYLNDDEINANYMLAYPYDQIPKQQASFTENNWNYTHALVLQDYARDKPNTPTNFTLPVVEKAAGWEERVIPGAPEAFLKLKNLVFGEKLTYGKEISKKIQKDINNYLVGQNLSYFISLNIPIKASDNPIGIINVELNSGKFDNLNTETQKELFEILNPFCALLGILILCED